MVADCRALVANASSAGPHHGGRVHRPRALRARGRLLRPCGQAIGPHGRFLYQRRCRPRLRCAARGAFRLVVARDGHGRRPARFDLVESAAGNGHPHPRILDAAARRDPAVLRGHRSAPGGAQRRSRAAHPAMLASHLPHLSSSGGDAPADIEGVLFANEPAGRLPVHLVEMTEAACARSTSISRRSVSSTGPAAVEPALAGTSPTPG